MSRALLAASVAMLLVTGGVGATLAVTQPQDAVSSTQQAQSSCDYEQVFDRAAEAVVSIQTGSGQGSGFAIDAGPGATGANVTVDTATGSETANATHIVTNAHVVGGADEVTVQFRDGAYRTADVVGQSAYADLAVVAVTDAPEYVDGLDIAARDPQHGERVAAVGSPFGLEKTITHGIVSGVNRSMPTNRGFSIPNVVQTDAAINPGNSGGPLVACDESVVGVNTAGIASSRAENIGFAVSASVVHQVVPDLIATGEFDYPYLGVSTTPVTPTVAEANDLNVSQGLLVSSVHQGGPAEDALQGRDRLVSVDGTPVPVGGDVVLSIDGRDLRTGEELAAYLVTETEPGQSVELTVLRDGERRTVTVTIGERPEPRAR